jgi:hypothetical protein
LGRLRKPPFGGPSQVLAYLARYTHRAAIANSRLVEITDDEVAFAYKDYRRNGRRGIMRLAPDEFIRRFLQHVLPDGFHRIRHYGRKAAAPGFPTKLPKPALPNLAIDFHRAQRSTLGAIPNRRALSP